MGSFPLTNANIEHKLWFVGLWSNFCKAWGGCCSSEQGQGTGKYENKHLWVYTDASQSEKNIGHLKSWWTHVYASKPTKLRAPKYLRFVWHPRRTWQKKSLSEGALDACTKLLCWSAAAQYTYELNRTQIHKVYDSMSLRFVKHPWHDAPLAESCFAIDISHLGVCMCRTPWFGCLDKNSCHAMHWATYNFLYAGLRCNRSIDGLSTWDYQSKLSWQTIDKEQRTLGTWCLLRAYPSFMLQILTNLEGAPP